MNRKPKLAVVIMLSFVGVIFAVPLLWATFEILEEKTLQTCHVPKEAFVNYMMAVSERFPDHRKPHFNLCAMEDGGAGLRVKEWYDVSVKNLGVYGPGR